MKIRIEELKERKIELSSEEALSDYSTLQSVEKSGECRFTVPLSVKLTVGREYDHIRVNGSVSTSLILDCSRCLNEFTFIVDSSFTVFYMKDDGTGQQDEDVELEDEDLISATYRGDEIDFTNEIAEQVLLSIPVKPLCGEDCKGLCPDCGTNLNETECSCNREHESLHFNALKNFEIRK